MRRIFVLAALFGAFVIAGSAQTTYYHYSNGVNGTAMRVGNTTYTYNSNGVSGTAMHVGNTTY
jgi:hypothetical protein